MRTRIAISMLAVLLIGAICGTLMAPPPAGGVSKEMVQLQQQVTTLTQNQQDMRSAMDQQFGQLKVLVEQSSDAVNRLNATVEQVQKASQDEQANSGSRVDQLATQTQAISDNVQVLQTRVAKLSDQLTDVRNVIQSLDAKISGDTSGMPPAGGEAAPSPQSNAPQAGDNDNSQGGGSQQADGGPSGAAPPSAEVLYSTALRDFTGGQYDIAKQEFTDYLKNFPTAMLAGNARFYLGEIAFAQGDYRGAIVNYNNVITKYPNSFKIAASHLKKGEAYMALKDRASATREFKIVTEKFPNTDEARRAQDRLNQLGAR